jgi:hypothetical protein
MDTSLINTRLMAPLHSTKDKLIKIAVFCFNPHVYPVARAICATANKGTNDRG